LTRDSIRIGTTSTGIRKSGDQLENFSYWLDKPITATRQFEYFNNVTAANLEIVELAGSSLIGSTANGNTGLRGGGGSGALIFNPTRNTNIRLVRIGGFSATYGAPVWFYNGIWYGPGGGQGGSVFWRTSDSDNPNTSTRTAPGGGGAGAINSLNQLGRPGNGLAVISYYNQSGKQSRVWHSPQGEDAIIESWTVPAGVTSIDIEVIGAGGSGGGGGGFAGSYDVSVTPGQTIWVRATTNTIADGSDNPSYINISGSSSRPLN
jgi:hypothetical protein